MTQETPVFIPASEERVAHLAEIQSMRAMTELLRNINTTLGEMQRVVSDTRERLIALESSGIGRSLDALRDKHDGLERRVGELEKNEHKRSGMVIFADGLRQWGPWVVTLAIGAWAIFGKV